MKKIATRNSYLWIGRSLLILAMGGWLVACNGKKDAPPADAVPADSAQIAPVEAVPDAEQDRTTLYGTSEEFGMSTFTLRDGSGRVYEVARTSEDGRYARIYGDLVEGQQYAMTLQADSASIDVLYNLTQLRRFLRDFYIVDGQLVVTADGKSEVVTIDTLSSRQLKATGKSGRVYNYKVGSTQ